MTFEEYKKLAESMAIGELSIIVGKLSLMDRFAIGIEAQNQGYTKCVPEIWYCYQNQSYIIDLV